MRERIEFLGIALGAGDVYVCGRAKDDGFVLLFEHVHDAKRFIIVFVAVEERLGKVRIFLVQQFDEGGMLQRLFSESLALGQHDNQLVAAVFQSLAHGNGISNTAVVIRAAVNLH